MSKTQHDESEQEAQWLAEVKEALGTSRFRIEFSETMVLPRDGRPSYTSDAAQIYVARTSGSRVTWTKAGPLLFPKDDGDRSDLFDLLSSLMKGQL